MWLNTFHHPSPWLLPLAKCVGPEDNQEISQWNIGIVVKDISVSWSKDRVVIVSEEGMHAWLLSPQEELFRITIDRKAFVRSMALLEDVKIIVSGHAVPLDVKIGILVSLPGSLCQVI